ncbi:MAG TPA: SpoIIE family protein phosphatase [Thermoanaerobaculia bacterium]|nr:SpoIIE family protein phosphatase [Thermoanaerobaculia bacterium]
MGEQEIRVAEVTVFTPLLSPARYLLKSPTVTIGRSADCTIPVKDRYLSRKHAEIVSIDGAWVLKDCGSANGTYLNGARVESDLALCSGDRIKLGDTEILFQAEQTTDRVFAVADTKISATIAIPVREIVDRTPELTGKSLERLQILNALAMELIEDKPFNQLFGFIVDRIMEHLKPSRAAVGLLADDGASFVSVEVRRRDKADATDLAISRTLLSEVVEEKKALAFMDVSVDEKLSRAKSIVMQGIHSVLCAPLTISDKVVGVLYVDYLFSQKSISEEDVRLVAQIARFAAVKLENARLRDDAIQKHLMDEELKTAYLIQRRLLPDAPPSIENYTFAGLNRPCRTVSGDYYDFVLRPDGRLYFVIADVSGKGVTAALPMAGLQTAFKIFTKADPRPNILVQQLNVILKENLPQSKFITLFAGCLDTASGLVEFTNAGHNPPLWVRKEGVEELGVTNLLLGMFADVEYQNQDIRLEPGDSLLLFTDGVTESENAEGKEFGMEALAGFVRPLHGLAAVPISEAVESAIAGHVGEHPLGDDVTLLVVSRSAL